MIHRTLILFNAVPIRIILPAVITVLLFVLTIFFLILPRAESQLMEARREMIRELTRTAWGTLEFYAEREKSGELTRENAQALATAHLRRLRYGSDKKDYFWINDMHPHMVMHPYRPDLEGRDISDMTDKSGVPIFVEFVRTVKRSGAGYVDYDWQWKDDPDRVVPKISYVEGFAPWGWIVGTGIYVEDVRDQIAAMTRHLTLMCLGILTIISALSAYIIWRSFMVTREKKRAQEQAGLRQKQLFQAAKMVSLGTLVSGVAHEINNPITSVMLNTPTLEKAWAAAIPILDDHSQKHGDFLMGGMRYSRIRDRIPQLLANIADGAVRVKVIVADLRDFAREKAPEFTEDVDLNKVVQKAVGLVSNMIRKSTDNFMIHYAEDLPLISANTQRLEQVVINLVVNACQSLPQSSASLRVATRYDAAENAGIIEVRDEGIGIPKEVLQRIKDPFFTTKRDSGGTGLGLAISDKIVEDHGGTLLFTSMPGQGTTVQVILPVREIRSTETATEETQRTDGTYQSDQSDQSE